MQRVQGVAPYYQIRSQILVGARAATLKASGTLRGLVAVIALGGVLLFLVVSVLDAVAILRRRDVGQDVDDGDAVGAPSAPRPSEPDERGEPAVVLRASEGRSTHELWSASRPRAHDGL